MANTEKVARKANMHLHFTINYKQIVPFEANQAVFAAVI